MSVRRSLFLLLALAIIMPVVIFNSQGQTTNNANSSIFENLQLYEVREGDVTLSVSAIGSIEPDNVIQLSFVTAGIIDQIYIQRDDYVLAGDLLVTLQNDLQRIAYEQALLGVERAELNLEDIRVVDETAIELAESAVDAAWGGYLSIENAVSADDINVAQLSYDQALETYNTVLAQRSTLPDFMYDTMTAQIGVAQVNADIARVQLESLQTRSRPQLNAAYAGVLQARAELERVQAGPTDFEIESSEIAIQQSEAQLMRAETAYNRTLLTAPFDGVISSLNIELGSGVAPGITVLEITDISPLRLTVQVDEIDIGLIDEGLPVRVELDALPGVEILASISRISPAGNNQGGIVTYDVDIDLNDVDPRVRVGMTAEATIVIQESTNTLRIPNLYIRLDRSTGKSYVNVLNDDDTITEVEVQLGLRGQTESEILSGLESGQLIAVQLGTNGIAEFFGG